MSFLTQNAKPFLQRILNHFLLFCMPYRLGVYQLMDSFLNSLVIVTSGHVERKKEHAV